MTHVENLIIKHIENLKALALEAHKMASDNYGDVELLRKWEDACLRLETAEDASGIVKLDTVETKELFRLNNDAGSSDLGSDIVESDMQWQSASQVWGLILHHGDATKWHEEDAWGDYPYRRVWVNLGERQVLTYCEGDLTMMLSKSAEDFYGELQDTSTFYKYA